MKHVAFIALFALMSSLASGQEPVYGCTNPLAGYNPCSESGGYNPEATVDDGSCLFDHPCTSFPCVSFTECSGDEDGNGICDNIEESLSACLDPLACNYFEYTGESYNNGIPCFDDGSCTYDGCYGCWDMEACNFDPTTIHDCQYALGVNCCEYADEYYDCDGSCWQDLDVDGICDDVDSCVGNLDECGVCNGPGAIYECGCSGISTGECDCNGNVLDDCGQCGDAGGCLYCGYGTVWDAASQTCVIDDMFCGWQPDGNADHMIGVTDLLEFLGVFGDSDVDQDGVWDSADDCVGEYDECGVCNGPGPTVLVIESITVYYDSVYASQIDEWFVFEVGADTTYSLSCPQNFQNCGDPWSYQGYDYATVQIGDQCWFAENLRSENYENGDAIPSNLSDSEWSSTTSGAFAVHGEDAGCDDFSPDIDACDFAQSLNEYGRLYNWYAVDDVRGLCPSGWHVPTDGEWMTMEIALGMSEAEANGTYWRGTDQGLQMKTTYGWYGSGNGTNTSGFSGLPGGYRKDSGNFYYAGLTGLWWSSSPNGSSAWYRSLTYIDEDVRREYLNHGYGFSVRCVRDSE